MFLVPRFRPINGVFKKAPGPCTNHCPARPAAQEIYYRLSPCPLRCFLRETLLEPRSNRTFSPVASVTHTFHHHPGNLRPSAFLHASNSFGPEIPSEIDFPKSSEAFVCFECEVARVSWTYHMSGMETGMRALPHANETYFRVNKEGILCIQHQIPMGMGQTSFVDVLLCPDIQEGALDADGEVDEEGEASGASGPTGGSVEADR